VGKAKAAIAPGLRRQVWERDDFRCQVCGTNRDLQIDHIYPENRGGPTAAFNLETLCGACNRHKASGITIISMHPAFAEREPGALRRRAARFRILAKWFPNPVDGSFYAVTAVEWEAHADCLETNDCGDTLALLRLEFSCLEMQGPERLAAIHHLLREMVGDFRRARLFLDRLAPQSVA
jgi:hypothetical protein